MKVSKTKESFYITTPIYYPSNKLHLGNAYTTVVADVLARYKRLAGFEVFFLTGMDEHGQKIQRTAAKYGMEPQAYVDQMAKDIRALWEALHIRCDGFIRTTDAHHKKAVQYIFDRLYRQGDIYEASYEGHYCTSCEAYWTEGQAKDGLCPDCGKKLEWAKESNYFFRLSKYGPRILEYFKSHPDFLRPSMRMNEMIANFLEPGLKDIAVSRNSFDWGVRVPQDPSHVVYVWIDALSNYISALGFPENRDDADGTFARFWPADVHFVGKDIARFHALIWPGILMALGLPLPKQIFAHGWLLMGGEKMSKSRGNVIYADQLAERYGVDAVRYYLMREIPFGMDGGYSYESFFERLNADLANDLGNLLSRSTAMVKQYFGGLLPAAAAREAAPIDEELRQCFEELRSDYAERMDALSFNKALAAVWKGISRANKYIDETFPWILAKDESKKGRLAAVLGNLLEALRQAAILLRPFMPESAEKIFAALALSADEAAFAQAFAGLESFEIFETARPLDASKPLFPRLDIKKEMAYCDALAEEQRLEAEREAAQQKLPEQEHSAKPEGVSAERPDAAETSAAAAADADKHPAKAEIAYEDFGKLRLRIATVTACEKVKKADRLLCAKLDLGRGEQATVVSGIAEAYRPEELIGKQVLYLQNLQARKIRGIVSQGMLLCAENEDGSLSLLRPDRAAEAGAEVS